MEKIIETPEGNFIIRPYREDDEAETLILWKAAFNKELSVNVWRWKFMSAPDGHKIMMCIDSKGKPIAMFSGVCYRTNLNGITVEMTHLMDNMSHPTYRKSGLFVRTVQAFVDEYTGPNKSVFLYGFPGKIHFDIGAKYHQYRELGSVSFLRFDLQNLQRDATASSDLSVERLSTVSSQLDSIWQICSKDYPFSVIRDSRFVQWRFFDNPIRHYDIWTFQEKDTGGYAAVLTESKRAILVDMLISKNISTISRFISQLIRLYRDKGFDVFETWLPSNHFITHALIEIGFQPLPEPLGFIPTGRTFDPNLTFDWASENIYYTMADGDLF